MLLVLTFCALLAVACAAAHSLQQDAIRKLCGKLL